MQIFQALSTWQWGILVKSRKDSQMAAISNRKPLAKATSLSGVSLGPNCLPFGCIEPVGYESER